MPSAPSFRTWRSRPAQRGFFSTTVCPNHLMLDHLNSFITASIQLFLTVYHKCCNLAQFPRYCLHGNPSRSTLDFLTNLIHSHSSVHILLSQLIYPISLSLFSLSSHYHSNFFSHHFRDFKYSLLISYRLLSWFWLKTPNNRSESADCNIIAYPSVLIC